MSKSLRIFISQPMAGRSDEEIERTRQLVKDAATKVFDVDRIIEIPKRPEWQVKSNPPVMNLGRSIEDLSRANVVIFSPGWNETRGCQVEHLVCELYKISYIEFDENFEVVSSYGRVD